MPEFLLCNYKTDFAGGAAFIKKPFTDTIVISTLHLRLRHASVAAKWPIIIITQV